MRSAASARAIEPGSTVPRRRLEGRLAALGVRAVNVLGKAVRSSGLSFGGLDADRLVARAARDAALADYGGYPLVEPLNALIDALETEASLNTIGRLTASWEILRLLRNRLELQRDWMKHPDIASQPVDRPVFIIGLPRSGTTLLHSLLAQDPRVRYPSHWEVMYPSPPGPIRGRGDGRIRRVRRELRWFYRLAPDFRAIHMMGVDYPQECTEISNHTFLSLRFDTLYSVPSYRDWVDRADLRPVYEFHRRMLQHLQWHRPPGQWVLKAPDHVFGIDALLATYPDARIVMTHRDPLRVVPSVASMTVALQGLFSDLVDPRKVARTVAARWADGARRMRELRLADRTPGRYLDVQYADLTRDPMRVVRDLYAQLALSLPAAVTLRMEEFLTRNPQGRHGRHRYSLGQFDLDSFDQRRRFRDYIEFFRVPAEEPPR